MKDQKTTKHECPYLESEDYGGKRTCSRRHCFLLNHFCEYADKNKKD